MNKIYLLLLGCVCGIISVTGQITPDLYKTVDHQKMNQWPASVFDALSYAERIGPLFMPVAAVKHDARHMQKLMRYVTDAKIG